MADLTFLKELSQRQKRKNACPCPCLLVRDKSRDKNVNHVFVPRMSLRTKPEGQKQKNTFLSVGTKVGTKTYINIYLCLSLSRRSWGDRNRWQAMPTCNPDPYP